MDFLSADVQDPTDFPPDATAPGLRILDGSFRCDICGELYDAPVTIGCGHCFCSGCIRTSLSSKQECPSCRKAANEVHIRPNPVLESVVVAWSNARPFVLQLVRREMERHGTLSQQHNNKNDRKRKRSPEWTSSPDAVLGGVAASSRNPTSGPMTVKSPSRLKKTFTGRQSVIDLTDSDSESEPIASSSKADGFVPCPICHKRVRFNEINAHIDKNCEDVPPPQNAAKSWSKIMAGGKNGQQKGKSKKSISDSDDEHPLPLATYATLKDRQLKDMLSQHDLPLTGNRAIWEQRHQKWVMLFNANLDRSPTNRKSKADLRKELKKWEEEKSKKKKTAVTDVKGHQIEYKSEFTRLVEAARQSRKSKPPEAPGSSPPAKFLDQTPPPSSFTAASNNAIANSEGEGEHGKDPGCP